MPRKASLFFGVVFLFIHTVVYSQEFTKSLGMSLFNRASYDSAVTEIKIWITQNPEGQDIANYYLAESYYNLGMVEPQVGRSRENFRNAFRAFQEVLKFTSVKDRYPKIYYSSQIKLGWCYFRRAETGEQPDVELDNSYINFIRLGEGAPDSLLIQSYLMAGESKYLEGFFRKYNAFSGTVTLLDVNKIIAVLRDATNQFRKVLNNQSASSSLKLAAELRINDIKYQLGRIYQSLPDPLFADLLDDRKQGTAQETALYFFQQANYSSVTSKYPEAQVTEYQNFLQYSEGMKWLAAYISSFQFEDKRKFLDAIGNVQLDELDKEKQFRFGMADHNTSQLEDNENFFNLYQNDQRSYYFQSLPEISEAYFWLGTVQFIGNQGNGIENLDTFVQRFSSSSNDARLAVLLDYARYWRGMLYLEEYRDDPAKLADLERFLNEFKPKNESLQVRVKQLEKLTKLELNQDVWKEVLQGESSTEWFNEAILIIQYLLRRAATVVGLNRMHYLEQLNRIFYYTNFQKSNETAFYQGISRSLEAEIQGDEDDKRQLFKDSADLLATVTDPYKSEADYIRGRSLFFSERYDDAKKVFRELINNKSSLRSLYYFAEILRQAGFGNAAKNCYEVIKQKTQDNPDGKFWYVNAESAINLCVNRADGSKELNGLNFQNVVFPDKLFDQSYEQLADRKFVRFQYLQESQDLLKKYASPKKTVYFANLAPVNSIFKENTLEAIPGILNEMLRRETSVVDLFVLMPDISGTPVDVLINNKPMEVVSENHYRSAVLSVGDDVNLTISKENYYFYQKDFDVTTPGKQEIVVPLSEKVAYRSSTETGTPLSYFSFPERIDGNMVIQRHTTQFPEDSKLIEDLSTSLSFRDGAFHPGLRNFLVIDSENKKALKRYDPSGNEVESNEYFTLQFGNYEFDEIKDAEGLTIDNEGNIYITDFAIHRVVVFDSLGRYKNYFGDFGRNFNDHQAEAVRFVFPTRIGIEEDLQGFEAEMNGEKTRVFRMPFVLVADRYGIHRCDLEGSYIETVIEAGSADLKSGEIYSLGINNYGRNAKIFLGLRQDNRVLNYSAYQIR
jgi:hypothetical protein